MSVREGYVKRPLSGAGRKPLRKERDTFIPYGVTEKELIWFHVVCDKCKEDVTASLRRPEECVWCGSPNATFSQIPKVKAIEKLAELEREPYWEKKRQWKQEMLFGKKEKNNDGQRTT